MHPSRPRFHTILIILAKRRRPRANACSLAIFLKPGPRTYTHLSLKIKLLYLPGPFFKLSYTPVLITGKVIHLQIMRQQIRSVFGRVKFFTREIAEFKAEIHAFFCTAFISLAHRLYDGAGALQVPAAGTGKRLLGNTPGNKVFFQPLVFSRKMKLTDGTVYPARACHTDLSFSVAHRSPFRLKPEHTYITVV